MNAYSAVLVAAQFGLIALILSPVNALFAASLVALVGLLLIGCSTLLALWAMFTLKLSNFSVLPEPVNQGELIRTGPYRWIRHPMYGAVVLACLGATISHGEPIKWIWMICLCLVLVIKVRREETLLKSRYSDYEHYSKRTHALIPYIY